MQTRTRIAATLATIVAGLAISAMPVLAEMTIRIGAPWDGKTVPADQVCGLQGGDGSTPPFSISGLPAQTTAIQIEYNDISYVPMAFNGGHGVIEYAVSGEGADLPVLPAMTADLPPGASLVSAGRGSGQYASDGYMPPCSGGRGHRYQALVKAMGADGAVLESQRVEMGLY
ncbi:MAG: hypothetical protein KIT02_14460 [Devosia sp.]|uniref:hypothetical protein n=1 Tax=Devosia sp. TaxID=1871048 RepID=UPI0024C5B26C|nr:hypothetical protein [Devosia sp.]UYN99115.1 MAG: hypothetical protein KIT02_14460 [Devosia sp.]